MRTSETIRSNLANSLLTVGAPYSPHSFVNGRRAGVDREWKEERSNTFPVLFYPSDSCISITYGLCENIRMNI